jgi:hypothetical protein
MKTYIVRLRRDKSKEFVLSEIAERVDRLWNAANYVCRQRYIKGEGVPGYSALCKLIPKAYPVDYARLPSEVAQEVLKKLSEAWASFFALIELLHHLELSFIERDAEAGDNSSGEKSAKGGRSDSEGRTA